MHKEMMSVGFLVEPQNQFVISLASKPLGRFLNGLASKALGWFSPVWPQNWWRWFLLVWSQNWWWVSWLSLKTKVVEGFPIWTSKLQLGLMIWASKSPRRFLGLGLKTKWAMVCLLHLKTDGRAMAWDTYRGLAACFALKQVGLRFSVWPQD
jgi:hypothetical protein